MLTLCSVALCLWAEKASIQMKGFQRHPQLTGLEIRSSHACLFWGWLGCCFLSCYFSMCVYSNVTTWMWETLQMYCLFIMRSIHKAWWCIHSTILKHVANVHNHMPSFMTDNKMVDVTWLFIPPYLLGRYKFSSKKIIMQLHPFSMKVWNITNDELVIQYVMSKILVMNLVRASVAITFYNRPS